MSNESASSGIGFGGLLTILFIGLKLTHYIDWSWWWVLSPLWLGLVILLLILIIGIILIKIGRVYGDWERKQFRKKMAKSSFQTKMEGLLNKQKDGS